MGRRRRHTPEQVIRKLREADRLLAIEAFDSLLEAKTVIEDWRNTYNTIRPRLR